MRRMKKLLTIALIALGCALVSPSVSQAQGRGHGRGLEKKSFRFINGHDARDGRWDGRGPRMNRRIFWDNGFFGRRVHRGRYQRFDRDFDRDDFRRFNRMNRFERRSWRWNDGRRDYWRNDYWRNASRWRSRR